MENKKPIKIEFKIAGGENSVIPKNIVETLKIEVVDGAATYRFNDSKTTRLFAARQHIDGVQSVYVERLQKTICKYPNMSQQEIVKHITERIKSMEKKKDD
jgi:hypothetical protein